MDLLIEKTAANKHSDIFPRTIHNTCQIKLTLRYFSYIYVSNQMHKTWSCVTFYNSLNRFPQGNDNCSILPENELIQKFMQDLDPDLFLIFCIFMKKNLVKRILLTNKKNPEHI